jgi:phage gpG-like protein
MSVVKEEFDDPRFLGGVFVQIESQFNSISYEPTLKGWLPDFYQSLERHFDARESPAGQSWPEWAFRAMTAPQSHETLEVSGRLKESLRSGSEHIEDVGDRHLTAGTSVPYAKIHQEGASFNLGIGLISRDGSRYLPPGTHINIPARPFMGVDEQSLDSLCDRVADRVVDALKPRI